MLDLREFTKVTELGTQCSILAKQLLCFTLRQCVHVQALRIYARVPATWLSNHDIADLFRAIDFTDNGRINIHEFRSFVYGGLQSSNSSNHVSIVTPEKHKETGPSQLVSVRPGRPQKQNDLSRALPQQVVYAGPVNDAKSLFAPEPVKSSSFSQDLGPLLKDAEQPINETVAVSAQNKSQDAVVTADSESDADAIRSEMPLPDPTASKQASRTMFMVFCTCMSHPFWSICMTGSQLCVRIRIFTAGTGSYFRRAWRHDWMDAPSS